MLDLSPARAFWAAHAWRWRQRGERALISTALIAYCYRRQYQRTQNPDLRYWAQDIGAVHERAARTVMAWAHTGATIADVCKRYKVKVSWLIYSKWELVSRYWGKDGVDPATLVEMADEFRGQYNTVEAFGAFLAEQFGEPEETDYIGQWGRMRADLIGEVERKRLPLGVLYHLGNAADALRLAAEKYQQNGHGQ